jgi:RNA polymerase sigma factor (sigma-70 family)
MNDRGISRLLDYLRRAAPPGPDLAPDGVLLGKYADTRDEPAFELIVRRHGLLVWSAVQRILRDEHAAEDALQGTFLALARKAHSLRGSTSVAGWLYRVAVRIALHARPKAQPTLRMPDADGDPAIAVERNELIAVVDEAVNRLPERLRQAVVLCCLGGHTTEEAARRLGCPRGTILSRLHAARERLRQQLAKRGFEAAAIGPLLAECGPVPLTSSLIAIAVRAAGPAAALSPVAITLAQGALHAMLMTKVKVAAIAIVAAGLGMGVTHWAGATAGAPLVQKEKPTVVRMEDPQHEPDPRIVKQTDIDKRVELDRHVQREELAKAEARLWKVLDEEEHNREELRDKLFREIPDVDNLKRKLEIVVEMEKPGLMQMLGYELELTIANAETARLVKEKADEKAISVVKQKAGELRKNIECNQLYQQAIAQLRDDIRGSLTSISRGREKIEAQIRRSELREQLELEKYRKLLK